MMKRLLVVVALAPMMAQAHDISVGTFSLTGDSNFAYSSSSTKENDQSLFDTTTLNLSAAGLYYVVPNLGVGLNFGYNSTEDKAPNGDKSGLSTFLFGPVVGYDFPVAEKVSLFAQGFLGYASSTATSTGSPDVKGSGYGYGIAAGLKYFVVKAFSFDGGLAYNYTKLTFDAIVPGGPKPEIVNSGFGVNVGLSVYFGG